MSDFPSLASVIATHRWMRRTAYTVECTGCDWKADLKAFDKSSTVLVAEHVERVWLETRTIRTTEQLDALPFDATVVDRSGTPRTKRHGDSHMPAGWTHAGRSPLRSHELADGRDMLLVWHPEWVQP